MGESERRNLARRIQTRDISVALVGMGYVGLPLAVAFAEAGYQVTGIDVNADKVAALNRAESYIEDVPDESLAALVARGALRASTEYDVLGQCDAVIICVPTPLRKTGSPDVSHILSAAHRVGHHLHRGMLVVLESTTYPGTTREIILPRFQRAAPDLEVGADYFLCYSPERVDPGRTDWTTRNTPKIMGGITSTCLDVGMELYAPAIETLVPVSSTDAAELTKLVENTYRAVNIGLANEVLLICNQLGLNAWEVIDAAGTKPFGFMKFQPGPGLGGHCIPVDPRYLSWKLRTLGYTARFIELATEINTAMPQYWVQKLQDVLNDAGKPLKGSRVLVIGAAYKKNVSDLRESPALDIMLLLHEKGTDVSYHDYHVPRCKHGELALESVTDLDAALARADCVLIATDHDSYDWADLHARAKRIVDTRDTLGIEGATGA